MAVGAEQRRLEEANRGWRLWREWGPYVSERAWGTVREDYSPGGDAWSFFPHDHARSRAYRWNEDGMAGICDAGQVLCLSLALWNGQDPILKERMFGLTNAEGNHGEDVKEHWWYEDCTPTYSWMRWRYHYPQRAFPYAELVSENGRRGKADPEYELLDTGAFDEDRYWVVTVDYAKAAPADILMRIRVRNRGPESAVLHVLPTLWFRNTWAWRDAEDGAFRPVLEATGAGVVARDLRLGEATFVCDGEPVPLVCDNETNSERLWGTAGPPYPKDGINDHVVAGAPTVAPDGRGTKAALHHVLEIPAGGAHEIRARLVQRGPAGDLGSSFENVMELREGEADAFFADLLGDVPGRDRARIFRQALAGLLWSKQHYHIEIDRWLAERGHDRREERGFLRNTSWRHVLASDVVCIPDKWEYPWYSAWELACNCVALAHVDPGSAKEQLLLQCRETYMRPDGMLPAYEWNFGDVSPPLQAWAGLRVFDLDGGGDFDFLARLFHKLVLNFTWLASRRDPDALGVFEGGALGLDQIGVFDRSAPLPGGGTISSASAALWTGMYCIHLLEMAVRLALRDPAYEDMASKFFEHAARLQEAMEISAPWDDADGMYYDVLRLPDGENRSLDVRSIDGLIPLCSAVAFDSEVQERLPRFVGRMRWFRARRPDLFAKITEEARGRLLVRLVDRDRLRRILARALDEEEFLSSYGLRSLSRYHADHPYRVSFGGTEFQVAYEPGESRSGMFGGNTNWRGPIWFPPNVLIIDSLRRYHAYVGDTLEVELPAGSSRMHTLGEVADELARRLIALFERDASGLRPVHGGRRILQGDAAWNDHIAFHEYFNGDTGEGLGASHHTGWTALVADLIRSTGTARGALQPV